MTLNYKRLYRALVLASCLVAASIGHAQLTLQQSPGGKASLKVFGDVKTVLDGKATGSNFQPVDRDMFMMAIGCASVNDDPTSQGEAFILHKSLFIKSVDPTTSYATQRTDGVRWGSFLAGLEPGAEPAAVYDVNSSTPISLDAIYKQIHRKHGALVAIAGTGQFSVISQSAVKKAPVYGEPILGPKRLEYFHPTGIASDVSAIFFGMSLRSNSESTEETRKVFYVNPADQLSTAGQSHTHAIITKLPVDKKGADISVLPAEDAVVAHMLTQSTLESGRLVVYELKD